jgi:ribosomal protein S18 acetylase RimI-like enzyme
LQIQGQAGHRLKWKAQMDPTIREAEESDKEKVLRYLYNDDPLLNAYAINRIQNEIYGNVSTYVSLNDGSEIEGYLSIFESEGIDIWIRGKSLEVEIELLNFFAAHIFSVEVTRRLWVSSNPRSRGIIKEKFPDGKIDLQNVMIVRKGDEKLSSNPSVVRISEHEVEDYVRFVVPVGLDITEELIEINRRFLREHRAYGIFDEQGKIVSVASCFVNLPHVSVISGVETNPAFRRRGYASAVVSTLVRDVFNRSDSAMLYVNNDNYDAIRVYERLGFQKIAESVCAEINWDARAMI